jgi:hypothetical protein
VSWRLANALVVYRRELNAAFPDRSTASDGTVGDLSHQNRGSASDHNPWLHDAAGVGVVRAFDATAKDIPARDIAERLRLLGLAGDPRLTGGGYVIFERRIASAVRNWVWRDYAGANPHTKHIHLSVSRSAAGYDDTSAWHVVGGGPVAPPASTQVPGQAPVRVAVQPGETLSLIAGRAQLTLAALRGLNPGLFDDRHRNGNLVRAGELVRLR